ncbi:hypothetical protein [Agrobacterium sp. CG674]
MIPYTLSHYADQAAERYRHLTDAWQHLYSRALSSPDFGTGGQIQAVVAEAYQIAQSYLDSEGDAIASQLHEIAVEAQGLAKRKIADSDDDLLAIDAQTHLSESQRYIRDEIVAQINRDIANIRQTLQRAVLDVSMLARTRRLNTRAAVVTWRMTTDEAVNFAFTDRRSHRTPSAKFIRGLWRQTMLSVHNETTLMTIADHGLNQAAVLKLEEGVEIHVDTIWLDGQGTSYSDIRVGLFHPNSNAYLGVLDVSA